MAMYAFGPFITCIEHAAYQRRPVWHPIWTTGKNRGETRLLPDLQLPIRVGSSRTAQIRDRLESEGQLLSCSGYKKHQFLQPSRSVCPVPTVQQKGWPQIQGVWFEMSKTRLRRRWLLWNRKESCFSSIRVPFNQTSKTKSWLCLLTTSCVDDTRIRYSQTRGIQEARVVVGGGRGGLASRRQI